MSDHDRAVGWYRDPVHPIQHRYWNGARWEAESERLDAEDAA